MERKTNRPVVPEEMMAEVARSMMADYHSVRDGSDSPTIADPRLKEPNFRALAYLLCEAYVRAANGHVDPEVIQGKLAGLLSSRTTELRVETRRDLAPETKAVSQAPQPQDAAIALDRPDSFLELD